MKKKKIIIVFIGILAAVLITSLAHSAGFLDYPHKYDGCSNCHLGHHSGEPSLLPPHNCTSIDDTQHNTICASCHDSITATFVKTHSSIQTDTDYGDWSVECRTCHYPHKQMQLRTYGVDSHLYSEQSDNIQLDTPAADQSQMTDNEAAWTPNEFQGLVFIANVNDATTGFKGYGYKILSNTATVLTVEGNIDTAKAPVGSVFAVIHGDIIKDTVTLDDIIQECGQSTSVPDQNTFVQSGAGWMNNEFAGLTLIPDILHEENKYTIQNNTPDTITTVEAMNLSKIGVGNNFKIVGIKTGDMPVKLFRSIGANDYADGDATYDGICEVCHTQTMFHRNNATGDHVHQLSNGCTGCHTHADGFAPSCSSCHGYPPVDASTLVDNVLRPPGTGSATAGQHDLHVNTLSLDCDICHNGSVGTGAEHDNGLTITLGFSLFGGSGSGGYDGGNYDGQLAAAVPNGYNTSEASTTVTFPATGSKTCDSIYCHSNIQNQSDGGATAITYAQPVWDGSVQCGECHKADGTSGLGTLMDSGTHTRHVGGGGNYSFDCNRCHDGKGPASPATHVNNDIDMAFDALNPTAAYSQSPNTPQAGYGSCTTTYCHDPGDIIVESPTWGGSLADAAQCDSCHGGNALSTAALGQGPMSLDNHPEHMNNTGVIGTNYECAQCHDDTVDTADDRVITGLSFHADGTKDINIVKGGTWNGVDTCTNLYCHSEGKGSPPTYQDPPTWGSATDLDCKGCHGTGGTAGEPDYASTGAGLEFANSHSAHVSAAADCVKCHTDTTTTGTAIKAASTLHTDTNIDVTIDGAYDDDATPGNNYLPGVGNKTCSTTMCHGGVSPQWGIDNTGIDECTKCHGTRTGPVATDAEKAPPRDTDGDTLASNEEVGAHQEHMTGLTYTDELNSTGNCNECHTVPGSVGAAGHIDSLRPAEVLQDSNQSYEKANLNGVTPTYTYAGNTCSVYCHGVDLPISGTGGGGSDKTPAWNDTAYLSGTPSDNDDGSGDCEKCHDSPPLAVTAHDGTETLSGATGCFNCHDHFNDGGSLNNASLHIDGTVQAQADCNSCHQYPPYPGDGKSEQAVEGKGAHQAHVDHLEQIWINKYGGSARDAANDTFGVGTPAFICGACHTNTVANHRVHQQRTADL
jgi:predicted CxxxxCH...CXXCH cytochrome family protein